MDRKVFTAILLSLAVVGLVALTFALFQPFLLALLWGAVLATVTYPAYEQLVTLLRGHRAIAALLMTLVVLILILGPFFTLALHFYEEVRSFRAWVDSDEATEMASEFLHRKWVQDLRETVEQATGGEKLDASRLRNYAIQKFTIPTAQLATNVLNVVFGMLMSLAFVAISVYYFFRDGRRLVDSLRGLLPMSDEDRDAIFGDLHGAITAAVRGGLVTAVVQGILGFIIFFLLDVGNPLLWAVVLSFASFIPVVGTASVWVPMTLVLVWREQYVQAVVLFAYGVLIIAMSDNLLRPVLVGQHMEAHPMLLFFGILGGILLFGFSGIILGPVVVAFLGVSARLFRREFAQERARRERAAEAAG